MFLSKEWITVGRPGYQGKTKDDQQAGWDKEYGKGKWRIAWALTNGEVWDFNRVFNGVYVLGYVRYFETHPDEAKDLTDNFVYAYDKELVTKKQAFDSTYLYNRPGHPNQFHNVALNIALEKKLHLKFKGREPIQVREDKPGWRWSPGRIVAPDPGLIPGGEFKNQWWQESSIEALYQQAKVLQIDKRLWIAQQPLKK